MVRAADGIKDVTIVFDVDKSFDGLVCHIGWVQNDNSANSMGDIISSKRSY
eukprot:UN25719